MRHFRFFISSPGDVRDERTFAQQVVDELEKDPLLRGKLTCEAVCWDDPAAPVPMSARLTPQEAINHGLAKPSDCDVVIVILWSRIGTPLTEKKPDGTPYASGTEWEYEDAMAAPGKPHVLVYHRKTPVNLIAGEAHIDEKLAQWRGVQEFLAKFRNADGTFKGGYSAYETPQEFRDRLRNDLRSYFREQLRDTEPDASGLRAHPPYGYIASALRKGQVVPFIGHGVHLMARTAGAHWDPEAPKFLPSGVELARLLAQESHFPSEEEMHYLAEVASYFELTAGRNTLREELRRIFGLQSADPSQIPPLYTLLAGIPCPLLIITTNYDTQLEQAFRGVPYDLVVYPADRKELENAVLWWPHASSAPRILAANELDLALSERTVIFKMHGTTRPESSEWDGVVITEADHMNFLTRIGGGKSVLPPQLALHVAERSVLFIGFSLRDWWSRAILTNLKLRRTDDNDQDIPRWAVNDRFTTLETKFWQGRGIYAFEVGLDTFVADLGRKLLP